MRVVCTDRYHRDTEEFTRRGFRFLEALELLPVHTNAPASRSFTLNRKSISSDQMAPVKAGRREHGEHVYRFKCSCGRDEQHAEFKLVDLVVARFKAACAVDPRATRIDLDITTI